MIIEVDVGDEFINETVVKELKQMSGYLKADLERHGNGEYVAVFTTDPIEDCAKIYDMIEAITKICKFYGAQDV
jgi:hypothetical protein